jgi:hypothetical protein
MLLYTSAQTTAPPAKAAPDLVRTSASGKHVALPLPLPLLPTTPTAVSMDVSYWGKLRKLRMESRMIDNLLAQPGNNGV